MIFFEWFASRKNNTGPETIHGQRNFHAVVEIIERTLTYHHQRIGIGETHLVVANAVTNIDKPVVLFGEGNKFAGNPQVFRKPVAMGFAYLLNNNFILPDLRPNRLALGVRRNQDRISLIGNQESFFPVIGKTRFE